MLTLKLDRTKLKTVSNYAKEQGKSRQTIYNWIDSGKIKGVNIDGVDFVYLG